MIMKKTKWVLASISAFLLLGLSISSCKKTTTATAADEETSTAVDNANAEHMVSDITEMAAQASDGSASLTSYRVPDSDEILGLSCASFSTSGKVITITFSGGICLDGRTRSGSISLDYSASPAGAVHYRDPGFTCTVTSNHYVVDGNQVNIINKTVTNNTAIGFNPVTTNLTWAVNAHVQIIKSGGGTIDWSCIRTKTLLNTSDTSVYHGAAIPISWWKARVGMLGSASGTAASGVTFTATIMNQLIRDFGACNILGKHPIIEGVIDFTPTGHPVRIIDYGNGTCDLVATITVNGVTHSIVLL
jgi:hypothetical protein